MIHKGSPWTAADRTHPDASYAKFLAGWEKFYESHPDGVITGDETPVCGPIFSRLNKTVLKILLLKMLHPDPLKRISIHDALRDRWVKQIDCCCAEGVGTEPAVCIDAAGKDSCKLAGKMIIKKSHHHLPPKESKIPQHRFDLGHGWS
jgi:protein-serine/threonine kinase